MSDPEVTDESEGMSALRKQLKAVSEERDTYRAAVQRQTIREAGLDPELGIVKRLAKDYEGEWTSDAFADFAKAEGLTPAPSAPVEQTAPGTPTPVENLSVVDQTRMAATSRIDALGTLSQPDEQPNLRQQIDNLEAKALQTKDPADWQAVYDLKGQWAAQINEAAQRT